MPLSPPPRDPDGTIVPHDHAEILAQDGIIRRISLQHVVANGAGGLRLSSMAFQASSGGNGGMSVDLQREIEEAGRDARAYVTSPVWTGSVRFTAATLRALDYRVGFDPLATNPYHGEVWGSFSRAKKTELCRSCSWFVQIPDVDLAC